MLIRFFEISTNTNDGVYRKSDFVNPTTNKFWKTTDTNCPSTLISQGSFNFDISDGVTELVIQLTDNSAPMRVTHVVAETEQAGNNNRVVAYVVDSIEYMGNKQIKYLLVEDTFLSHINIVSNTRMLVNRTNDESHFFEHDTTDLAYTRERTIIDTGLYDYTGKWVVYTLAINADDYSYLYVTYRDLVPNNYEQFSSLTEVKSKYPEVVTNTPVAFDYFGKIVAIGSQMRQAQYDYSQSKIVWTVVTASKPNYTTTSSFDFQKNQAMSGWIGPSVKLTTGDMLTVNLAFPVADNIMSYGIVSYTNPSTPVYGYRSIPSVDRISTIKLGTQDISSFIISKRIITGLAFNEEGDYRPSGAVGSLLYTSKANLNVIGNWLGTAGDVPVCITLLNNINSINKLVFTLSSPLEYEPFRMYFLNMFGQNIPIKSKLQGSDIYIKSTMSSTDWSVVVYSNNTNNVMWSGKINADMPYSLDKFQEFLAQNSTYNTSKWVNTVLGGGSRVATGFLSGYLTNPRNAMIGAGSGALSIGQDIWNYALQEKAMKDSPDTIKGDGNAFGTIDINPYGIYFYYMSPTNDSLELMKTEYYAKGHPTNLVTTIQNLNNEVNDIYNNCKFVAGRMVDMVYNYSITSRITERLKNGVFLLADPKTVAPEITNVSYNAGTKTITFNVYNKDTRSAIIEVTDGGVVKTSGLVTYNDYTSFSFTFPVSPVSIELYAKATAPGLESSDTTIYEYLV